MTALPRRILVTGARGFVGRHLLATLAEVLPEASLVPASFDVTDAAALVTQVRAVRPDACVHLAAVSAVPAAQADPDAAWRVNLHGTLLLARTLAAEAPGCTLLFTSSADAYGKSFLAGGELDESAALNPMNVYGATKAAADLALGAMAGDDRLRIIRVRPFNHTGPGQSPSFVVAAFARQVARVAAGLQPPALQVGALDPLRDFLDVRDVCRAYALCLQRAERMASGTILNIASGQAQRVGDILSELVMLAGVTAAVEVSPARLRHSEIVRAVGNPSLAASLLGWRPRIAWAQTLADVLQDWRGRAAGESA